MAAADRWTSVIVGDLPTARIARENIDDLVIIASGIRIDGPGGILGQAGPTDLRPGSLLPAKGVMEFDSADLRAMEEDGTLGDVITHEMGHVIGIGTIWEDLGLLNGARTRNPRFRGEAANREWAQISGTNTAVPVENTGGEGTRDGHWRDSVLNKELMTGFIAEPDNALSRITVASLQDIGYTVDLDAAEPFSRPFFLKALTSDSASPASKHGHTQKVKASVLPQSAIVKKN